MSCDIRHRCGSDLVLLWLWCSPVAVAPIWPLAWEHPYAMSAALTDKKKKKKSNNNNNSKFQPQLEFKDFYKSWLWECSDTLGYFFWNTKLKKKSTLMFLLSLDPKHLSNLSFGRAHQGPFNVEKWTKIWEIQVWVLLLCPLLCNTGSSFNPFIPVNPYQKITIKSALATVQNNGCKTQWKI